jgi:hypothetical protein
MLSAPARRHLARLNAIRGAYLADRKPSCFESEVWLPGDYEATYVIATIADY